VLAWRRTAPRVGTDPREACGDLADEGRVGPWLRGIAWNLFRNWRRARLRAPRPVEPDRELPAPHEAVDPQVEHLRRELDRLPSKERTALWMHYLEETSVREVAALLGVSEKAVEGRLLRGRRLLRERLAERGAAIARGERA